MRTVHPRFLRNGGLLMMLAALVLNERSLYGAIVESRPPGALLQDEADLPAATDVVRAYTTVRQWLDEFDTPALDSPESQIGIEGATAVLVQIRHRGRVVGQGVAGPGETLLVRHGAGSALADFLADPAMGNLPDDMRAAIARGAGLEVEVAGRMEPLIGRTFGDLASRVEPGLEGVALRRGQDQWIVRFPAQMRAGNVRLETYLPGLLTSFGIDRQNREFHELREVERISAYKFKTIHLAQAEPGATPFVTFRGGQVIPESAVTDASLREFAAGLLNHILERKWARAQAEIAGEAPGPDDVRFRHFSEPFGMFGTYHPLADKFDPLIASALEQGLTAYALARFAATPGVDEARAVAAATFAGEILRDLADRQERDPAQQAPGEPDPLGEIGACAMIVLAASEMRAINPAPQSANDLIENAKVRVIGSFDANSGSFALQFDPQGRARPMLSIDKAQVSAALARLLLDGDGRVTASIVRSALDATWSSVDERHHPNLLPWVGWAELDFAEAAGGLPEEIAQRFARLRLTLDESQVSRSDRMRPPDLAGGYTLRSEPFGTEVTSQGLRPASWRARLLDSPQVLAGDELAIEVGRMLHFARFLMQLSVTADCEWAYRNAARAAGGVRESLWDSTQPVAVQALALLTISDILRGIRRM